MKKIIPFFILSLCLLSCNKTDVVLQSSPHIKTFAFGSHDSIPGIEKITFTVDTINCLVYNEDSIAYGLKLNKAKPYITYTGTPKKIKVNGTEWNKTDSLDFTHPLLFYIQSQNKKNEATYTITLNQHKVDPDELRWTQLNLLSLPYSAQSIRCINTQENLYLFVAEAENTYIYTSTDANNWTQIGKTITPVLLPSIAVYNNQIYAIAADSTSLLSLNHTTWETTATFTQGKMADILGSINQQLYIRYVAQGNQLAVYNGNSIEAQPQATLPTLFGIDGYTKLNINNTIYLMGGSYNNQVQNAVISSDNGHYWTNVLNQTGEFAFTPRQQAAAVYYGNFLFLLGGYNSNMQAEKTHYLSNNGGYSWETLRNNQLLPEHFIFYKGTQAISFNNNLLLVGLQEGNSTQISIWKGRIQKIDFIKQ